jgi:hypothetical protein
MENLGTLPRTGPRISKYFPDFYFYFAQTFSKNSLLQIQLESDVCLTSKAESIEILSQSVQQN